MAESGSRSLVRVRNVGETDFTDQFAGRQYTIPAGSEAILEVEAICLWMGYPGLRDDPARKHYRRRDAYARLRRRYGWTMRMTPERWEEVRPKLEVYTLDNQRVWMIIDDPTGEKAEPATATVDDTALLREAFERQQREMEELRKLIRAREEGEDDDEVAEDSPRKVPVGARRGAAKG